MADERDQRLRFEEIHFSPLPSQTNIYGLTKVESNEEGNKVVLASLSGRVVCLEYPPNSLIPSSREVPFTYIQGEGSSNSFKRSMLGVLLWTSIQHLVRGGGGEY